MARQILERGFVNTLETGVAFGLSTLAICLALEEAGQSTSVHFGVDPDQTAVHKGAALSLLQEHGVAHRFQLLEGCTHEAVPPLLAQGTKIDFAFVDGWHTFDYMDFFYIDKLLRPGGLVSFHDCHYGGGLARSKRKVISWCFPIGIIDCSQAVVLPHFCIPENGLTITYNLVMWVPENLSHQFRKF
jgi:predicted O-methyltransferase YrrM